MNRLELVEKVSEKNGISKAEADRIVVTVFEEIMTAVTRGEPVTLIGFGTFRAVDCAPRTGRNPTTGEAIQIPSMRKPRFIAGSYFKDIVNETANAEGSKAG